MTQLGGKERLMNRDFTHEALVFERSPDAVAVVAGVVNQALAEKAAVICSVAPPLQAAVRSRLGYDDDILWLPADHRYARPVDAIAELSSFMRRRSENSWRIVAIGQPPYHGTAADQPWFWYDAGVNAVFGDEPLNALCLVDRTEVSDTTIAAACESHTSVHDANGAVVARPPATNAVSFAAPELSHPCLATPPSITLTTTSIRDARHALLNAVHDRSEDVRIRAELVLAELVTNAIAHGGTAAEIGMWLWPSEVVLRIRDHGSGMNDPWATLRPPRRSQVGGAGLWIAHRESDGLDVRNHRSGGTVATAVIQERAG
jgi:anti-sigma regulatory factor (Ser/Thr protein kinase)